MLAMEAVKEIMKNSGVTTSILRDRLGIKKEKTNVLSQRFTQKNVSVGMLDEMLKVMDYKIVILPRNARIPEDGYEVE